MNDEDLISDVKNAMLILRSSDFDPQNGMNETSFKAMIIQNLYQKFKNDKNIKISSEVFIKVGENTRYIDLLLEDIEQKSAIIFELKYVRLTFLKTSNGNFFSISFKNFKIITFIKEKTLLLEISMRDVY